MAWIDYGLGGLATQALDMVGPETNDMADLYEALSAEGALLGYEATERFYEIGSPASLHEADRFLRERA